MEIKIYLRMDNNYVKVQLIIKGLTFKFVFEVMNHYDAI